MRMTEPSGRSAVLTSQRVWAGKQGLPVSARGYLSHFRANLRQPLSLATEAALRAGSGSELEDRPARASNPLAPAKMRALHSSSALAVNVFDFWVGRDLTRVLAALHVDGKATTLGFEAKLPTGARGIPPNVDVVIGLAGNGLVGVESKFTEWMTPKGDMVGKLAPYVDSKNAASYWSRANLNACHRLAMAISARTAIFRHLDVAQLLKHALGIKRAVNGDWFLRYLYFDANGAAAKSHEGEISAFTQAVGDELRFDAIRYQDFLASLGPPLDAGEADYFAYNNERYFGR